MSQSTTGRPAAPNTIINIRVTVEERAEYAAAAASLGTSMSDIVRNALDNAVRKTTVETLPVVEIRKVSHMGSTPWCLSIDGRVLDYLATRHLARVKAHSILAGAGDQSPRYLASLKALSAAGASR